jgi:fumarate reductase subunit C
MAIQIYIMAAVGTLLAIGSGTLLYRASIHEQNCLSYERQAIRMAKNSLVVQQNIANLNQRWYDQDTSYELVPLRTKLALEQEEIKKNEIGGRFIKSLEAYKSTCGAKRSDEYWKNVVEPIFDPLKYKKIQ